MWWGMLCFATNLAFSLSCYALQCLLMLLFVYACSKLLLMSVICYIMQLTSAMSNRHLLGVACVCACWCVDQMFSSRMMVREWWQKRKIPYAAFIDLENPFERIDWETTLNVFRVYGVRGKLLRCVEAFQKDAIACAEVNGVHWERLRIRGTMKQGCVLSPLC